MQAAGWFGGGQPRFHPGGQAGGHPDYPAGPRMF
jgi:hypothetical protein